jgi:pilus assembly protein FimV
MESSLGSGNGSRLVRRSARFFGEFPILDRDTILTLAVCYRDDGKPSEAAREYKKVAEADPKEVFALRAALELEEKVRPGDGLATRVKLAERLAEQEWRLSALHHYRRAMEQLDGLPSAERARFAHIEKQVERMRAYFAERRDALSAYSEAASALERGGDDAEAADLYSRMLGIAIDNPAFWARRAEALCRIQRVGDALPAFRKAAQALFLVERPGDAIKVCERILHFRVEPEDALFAAELYLSRSEPKDALRAVTKLQPCLAVDPEDLRALSPLARAFEGMEQPARAVKVRSEMLRIAREFGESELVRELERKLRQMAPNDPTVAALLGSAASVTSSAPEISYRATVVSVTDEIEDDDVEPVASRSSVLADVAFEELPDEWVMPVLTKEARRAIDDARTFMQLRLFPKAEEVLTSAIADDPVCAELREALRGLLQAQGDDARFVDETLTLADLYRQRRFVDRARSLVAEAIAVEPSNGRARAFATELEGAPPR